MIIRVVFFCTIAILALANHCVAQSNFDLELSIGVASPSFTHENLASTIDGEVSSNSINIVSTLKVHYTKGDKDLFFVQMLYSNSGMMNYDVSNLVFPLDVDNETISKNKSSFNMSYMGIGAGSSYTFMSILIFDGSVNYIRHLDNTYTDVFFSGWNQESTISNGIFRSTNLLGSIGMTYKLGKFKTRIGYDMYFRKYQLDSLFGESNSRNDFNLSTSYRF